MSVEQKRDNEVEARINAEQEACYNTNSRSSYTHANNQEYEQNNTTQRFVSNDHYQRNSRNNFNRNTNYYGAPRGGNDRYRSRGRGGRGGNFYSHNNWQREGDERNDNYQRHGQHYPEQQQQQQQERQQREEEYRPFNRNNFNERDNYNKRNNDQFNNQATFDYAEESRQHDNEYHHEVHNKFRGRGGQGGQRGQRDFGGDNFNRNYNNNYNNRDRWQSSQRNINSYASRESNTKNNNNYDDEYNTHGKNIHGNHINDTNNNDYDVHSGHGDENKNSRFAQHDSSCYPYPSASLHDAEHEDNSQFTGNRNSNVTPMTDRNDPLLVCMPHQRTVRAPHLRQNCRNDEEILELFNVHHKQSGISLDIYANIPVEIVPRDVLSVEDFTELKVEPALAANIERCGYKKPTPVQRYGIPVALAKNDLMACAQTGSGKTAAFLIPVIQHILIYGVSPALNGVCQPIGLILAPTRELALQIYDEVRKLTFRTDIFYDVVYGGTPYPTRFENDILVACPGRLKDIFDRGSLSFKAIKFLILDEADRMLEMGFEEQIEYLVASRYSDMPLADARQTLMFSATFPQRILNLAKRYLRKEYYLLTVGRVGSTTKNITQVIEKVQEEQKTNRLMEIIFKHKQTDLILIFVETKRAAEDLHRQLSKENIPSSTIHGDRRQQDRERALAEFKSGETPILVATDVASRGLDIPDVSHVIQYDLPSEMDDYTHRIGRTGRAGNKGVATAFYTRDNRKLAVDLFRYLSEHEQTIPGWLRQEVETIEGEAFLTRGHGNSKRSGGGGFNSRFGGSNTNKNLSLNTTQESTQIAKQNLTWGQTSTGETKIVDNMKTKTNKTMKYDDGGF